jgi:hypothetical protein
MKLLVAIWKWLGLHVINYIEWSKLKGLFRKGKYWDLTPEDWNAIRKLCAENYYVILIRRKTHLTTYLISLASWLKTGKLGYWSHALMNLEDGVKTDLDFRLVEATAEGVHYSTFEQVFDCDAVCLLRPRGFSDKDWTETMDRLKSDLGKPYDMLFDLKSDQELSCVELVLNALEGAEDFNKDLDDLKAMIEKERNLVPDMYYDCKDLEIVFEIRR